jgi:hypothetical protein
LVTGLAGTVSPRSFELIGSGSPEAPWTMVRDAAPPAPPVPPRFLSMTDDAVSYFESSPPSPADWAVILDNLHRRGHRSIAIAPVLAWEDPDPIAFSAVDSQLERFRPAIAGMPVVRGISPEPIPPAFQRLSLPVARVDGDYRSLPIVNQLAVARASLGRTRAVAAFTRLESEQAPDFETPQRPALVPLLARWDDRVVFSLPLAVTLVRFSTSPDELLIRPGREIRLGERGPVIPIDLHGRAAVAALADPLPGLPLDSLIDPDRKEQAHAPPDPAPWIVRDERSRMTPDDRETSRRLADVLVALAGAPRGGHRSALSRPHPAVELTILLLLALTAGASVGCGKTLTRAGAMLGLAGAAVVLLLVLARFQVWQPVLATVVTPLAGMLTAAVQAYGKRRPQIARTVLTEPAVRAPQLTVERAAQAAATAAAAEPRPAGGEPEGEPAAPGPEPGRAKPARKRAARKGPATREEAPVDQPPAAAGTSTRGRASKVSADRQPGSGAATETPGAPVDPPKAKRKSSAQAPPDGAPATHRPPRRRKS